MEAGVEAFVLVSTDKAVNPTDVMGVSKRLAELALQGMQERSPRPALHGPFRQCARLLGLRGPSIRAVELLREAVPEYQPTESLRDHVWASKASKAGTPATASEVKSLRTHRAHLDSVPSAGRQKLRPVEALSPQPP